MNDLLVATLFLIGTHFGLASRPLREQLVSTLGEGLYRILYSLVAVLALVWLVVAWRSAPWIPLWEPGPALRHVPLLVMPLALLLVITALSAPNPTAVGQRPDADAAEPARGMLRVTRHPLLWGVALWAAAHMLANGDLAAVLFFGAFLVLALAGTVVIDARRSRANPPGWGVFLQRTSNLPFAAILDKRQRLVASEIGLARLAAALALFLVLVLLHPFLFGVAVLG
ncbi:NnrU family protein [Geminicoccaceae bacterium 1502E]|nr:NnrU family protein [Geminicoccaceae bacterium 1502E]